MQHIAGRLSAYVALPHQRLPHGWMVFNRLRCHPIASDLTRPQAVTLADALNIAASGEMVRPSRIKRG